MAILGKHDIAILDFRLKEFMLTWFTATSKEKFVQVVFF